MTRTQTFWNRTGKQAALACIAILGLAGLSFSQAAITLSPNIGPPTIKTLVSGSGFSANASIDIFFDTTEEAMVEADGSGLFSNIAIRVPASALPGQHTVTAVQPSGGIRAQASFGANTNWSQFGFTPKGDRFNPYENVLSPSNVSGLGLKWSYPAGIGVLGGPAVANGVVYFPGTYALNASTGALLWSYSSSQFGSPAVANGVVYVGCGSSSVCALNASTGALLWSYATDADELYSSPAVANGVVYVATHGGGYNVYALNASTGALLWSYYTDGNPVDSSPAVANGVVYVGDDAGKLYALNATTGALLWSYSTYSSFPSSPAVANGVVYIGYIGGDSRATYVYALNAATGAVLWRYPTGASTNISPGVAVANGVVYVGSGDGNVYALNATTGALLWSYNTGSGNFVDTWPAVANGVVYVGSGGSALDDNVYALDATTGALLWSYNTGYYNYVESSPTVVNGVVYVGSDNGTVYAFGLPDGAGPEKAP